jgi:hypothetical protein
VPEEAIRDIQSSKEKLKVLAAKYGLSINIVWRIKRGKRPDQKARLTRQKPQE